MTTSLFTKFITAAGGLALSLTAGLGTASAGPDLGPIVNSTCTYPQVMSALRVENPAAAAKFNQSKLVQSLLQNFLAAPPAERQEMATQLQSHPVAQEYMGTIVSVANTCNNY